MKATIFRRMQLVLLAYTVCHLSFLEGSKMMAGTYTTDFPLTENPISEGGNWTNGMAAGIDWSNVLTANGMAIGTQIGVPTAYNDSTALLTGSWGSNQTASATVYTTNQQHGPGVFEEVEIRLRSSLSAHSCTGYEINFSLRNDNSAYCQIVRWKGPLGSYAYVSQTNGSQCILQNGDVVKATIHNHTITAYINGTRILRGTDSTYSSGSPGMGFYLQGTNGVNGDYGFTNYTVTDGITNPSITMLASSQNPSPPDQPVTFTATVSGSGGTPTGTMQFKTNGVAFGSAITLSSASASSDPVSTLPHGSNAITAEYSGDMNFLTSTGSVSQVINTPPVGGSIALATTENTAVTVSSNKLLNVATDADGDALAITALNSPTNASATTAFDGNANVVYTPANGFTGADSFTYVVSDPFGAEATNTVNVTVNALNVSASLANITPLSDGTMQIIASGFPGTNYWIQATTNMSIPPWTTIATNAALANGLILFTDLCATNYMMRFYRLAVPTNN